MAVNKNSNKRSKNSKNLKKSTQDRNLPMEIAKYLLLKVNYSVIVMKKR